MFSQPFTEVTNTIHGISWGKVVIAGFDKNNNFKDILVTGLSTPSSNEPFTKLYVNNGGFNFSEASSVLTGLYNSAATATDYDNDGDIDFMITGLKSYMNGELTLYRNDGSYSFTPINTGITAINLGDIAWGDYDNDGDKDLLVQGYSEDNEKIALIYRNEGEDNFTPLKVKISNLVRGTISWGDFDNDGDLDILQNGVRSVALIAIFRNDGDEVFTEINSGIDGYQDGNSAWGDFDDDGDIDVLITGTSYSARKTSIYTKIMVAALFHCRSTIFFRWVSAMHPGVITTTMEIWIS